MENYKNGVNEYRTIGVVALFNPDIEEALRNIRKYLEKIDKLIIWDNSNNVQDKTILSRLEELGEKVLWYSSDMNVGLAPAINYTINYAINNRYDLVLTMDQDSEWDDFEGYINEIKKRYSDGEVCIFSANVNGTIGISGKTYKKNTFIISGTVYPLKVLLDVGRFDETFFVDALDYDYSIRARKKGYSIVVLTHYILHQKFGNPICSRLNFNTSNYSAWRTYWVVRNNVILCRKHGQYIDKNLKGIIWKQYILKRSVKIFLLESHKVKKIKGIIRGLWDAYRFPLSINE